MTALSAGSMCTGYGGLDLAVSAVLDTRPVWVADPDPGAAAILAHRYPTVPNLGDITTVDWTAVRRWEHLTGRRAPRPTDDRRRLAPAFVEWLMGLPPRWVTGVPGLTRNQQLRALGNGAVPAQAVAALHALMPALPGWEDAA